MAEQGDFIEGRHLAASIAIALKMARFRVSRATTESDEICAQAADAVVASFKEAGWAVVRTRSYPGFTSAMTLPSFGQRRRCEGCDD